MLLSNENLSSLDLFNQAPCGFVSMDHEGKIVAVNQSLLTWLGYEYDQMLSLPSFLKVLTLGSRLYFESTLIPKLRLQGSVAEVSMEFKKKSGRKMPVLINTSLTEDALTGKPIYWFSILDITKRKTFERELHTAKKEAEEKARQLELKNKDLERFAHVISHDLKGPLNTISGLLKILDIKDQNKSQRNDQILELVLGSTQKMKQMVDGLLSYYLLDKKDLATQPVDLQLLCNQAVDLLNSDIQKSNGKIGVDKLPVVQGIEGQLLSLFLNLFSNALKYRSEADPEIQVRAKVEEEWVRIEVQDNGSGFDPDQSSKVFGFMERLPQHSKLEGTGLGLANCQRIVERHGGKIWATSEKGKGSCFYFTLPLADSAKLKNTRP